MKPNKHVALIAIVALGVALAVASSNAAAENKGLAGKKPTGEAVDKGHEKEIQIESWSFGGNQAGKTGGANQLQMNDTRGNAPQQQPGAPMPSESMSLNFGQVKPATPPAPTDLGTKQDPKEIGLLVPAVQKVRDAATRSDKNESKEMKKK
jgi:hypothetical protein